jgi:hypothetical protein
MGELSLSRKSLEETVGSIACSSQSYISESKFFLLGQILSTKYLTGTRFELLKFCSL